MKKIIIIISGLLASFLIYNRCNTNSFAYTTATLNLEKTEFKIGEEFKINLKISSDIDQEIQFYNDFSNLNIWFTNRYVCENGNNGRCNGTLKERRYNSKSNKSKSSYRVSKDKPFQKYLNCKISAIKDTVVLSLAELRYEAKIPLEYLERGDKIGIHGLCIPINRGLSDPIEDYTNMVEFLIDSENRE